MQLGGNKNKRAVKWWNPWISMLHFPPISIIWKQGRASMQPLSIMPFFAINNPWRLGNIFAYFSVGVGVRSCLVLQPMQIAVEVNLKALNIYASPLEHKRNWASNLNGIL